MTVLLAAYTTRWTAAAGRNAVVDAGGLSRAARAPWTTPIPAAPAVMSAATVKTDYRRAANQRMYPTTLSSVCPFSEIEWIDLTSVATS